MGTITLSRRIANKSARILKSSLISLAMLFVVSSPVMAGSSVVITEFRADSVELSDTDGESWIELYNRNASPVDISGWKLIDAVFDSPTVIDGQTTLVVCNLKVDDPSYTFCDKIMNFADLDLINSGGVINLWNKTDQDPVDSFTYKGTDVNEGVSTIVDRDNDTGKASVNNNNENVFYQDEVNVYTDEETGTPGDVTVLDLIDLTVGISKFDELVDKVIDDSKCQYVETLVDVSADKFSVFAPSDTAINGIPVDEMDQLLANPDELCEFVAYHIVKNDNKIMTTDFTGTAKYFETLSGDMITTMLDGDDSLKIQLVSGNKMVDQAKVTTTAQEASNGVVYVINDYLMPQNPVVTFNPIITKSTSPELSGTYSLGATEDRDDVSVLIRINGNPYDAMTNEDGTWLIPAGKVEINPKAKGILYTVVLRANQCDCDELLALTMQKDVVSMPKDNGNVLGDEDKPKPPVVTQPVANVVSVDTSVSFGKGSLGDDSLYNNDGTGSSGNGGSQTDDTKDTGVTDDQATNTTNDQSDDDKQAGDDNNTWYWWFVGGGTVALVWYMLWRRPEVS